VAQASHHQKLLLVDNLGPRMLVVGCMARTRGVPRPPGQAATAAIPVGATGEFTDATGRVPSDDASMATRTDAISSHDPHGGVLDASVLPERPTPLCLQTEHRSSETLRLGELVLAFDRTQSAPNPSNWLSPEPRPWQLAPAVLLLFWTLIVVARSL
jgi:hypothetical protein